MPGINIYLTALFDCKHICTFEAVGCLNDVFQEMKKVVDMINYEIEYVLRPVSAPARCEGFSLIF